MMRRLCVVLSLVLGVAGCAGSQAQLRLLESGNALSVQPAPTGAAYDYVVSLKNVKDFGYDPDDQPTREATALRTLKAQCPNGRVVGETVIETGTYLLGNPSRTYAIQVACAAA
jgi:hypothetical protein